MRIYLLRFVAYFVLLDVVDAGFQMVQVLAVLWKSINQ